MPPPSPCRAQKAEQSGSRHPERHGSTETPGQDLPPVVPRVRHGPHGATDPAHSPAGRFTEPSGLEVAHGFGQRLQLLSPALGGTTGRTTNLENPPPGTPRWCPPGPTGRPGPARDPVTACTAGLLSPSAFDGPDAVGDADPEVLGADGAPDRRGRLLHHRLPAAASPVRTGRAATRRPAGRIARASAGPAPEPHLEGILHRPRRDRVPGESGPASSSQRPARPQAPEHRHRRVHLLAAAARLDPDGHSFGPPG